MGSGPESAPNRAQKRLSGAGLGVFLKQRFAGVGPDGEKALSDGAASR